MSEDKELYKKFLNGDKEAIEIIIKKYENNLKFFIMRYVKDLDIAEDVFQEVIVYILTNKEIYNDKYSLKTYLYTIAKSRALNHLKKQEREQQIQTDNEKIYAQEEKMLEDIILSNERKEKIAKIMKKLNSEYQKVIFLAIIEGLTYEETAQIMEKSLSQIKNLIHRARKKIKKLLIEEKVVEMRNNKIIRLLVLIFAIGILSSGIVYGAMKIYENIKNRANLTPIFTGEIGNTDYNSIWLGTFNLVWNELIEQYTKDDVEFEGGNTTLVNELNRQPFKKEQLSEEDYYIKVGITTPELEAEILKDLKNRFNIESSEVLKNLNFEVSYGGCFTIYAMLYKDFKFENPFDRLDNAKFAGSEKTVKYFGINNASSEFLNSNVEILFYNTPNDFAVKLKTERNDNEEIILYRTEEKKSFNKQYEEVKKKMNEYKGRRELGKNDELRVPYINVDTIINYEELCGKTIKRQNGLYIRSALQNVKFRLNEQGGNIISEAAIMASYNSFEDAPPMHFFFDDTFVLFIKEKDKEQPYMSLNVDNTDVLEME